MRIACILLLLLTVPFGAAQTTATTLPAAAAVDQYVQAIGGSKAVAAIGTRRIEARYVGRTDGWGHPHFRLLWKSPSQVRQNFKVAWLFWRIETTLAYNGTSAWFRDANGKFHDVATDSHMQPLPGMGPTDLEILEWQANPAFPALWRLDPGQLAELKLIDGREANVVNLSCRTGTCEYFFDAETHLLVGIAHASGKGRQSTLFLSDYRAVDGVKLPFRWMEGPGPNATGMQILSVKQNIQIADREFTRPQ